MNVHWKKLLVRIIFWLFTEIWFGSLGIDNLADYGEFVFEKSEVVQRHYSRSFGWSGNSRIMMNNDRNPK